MRIKHTKSPISFYF